MNPTASARFSDISLVILIVLFFPSTVHSAAMNPFIAPKAQEVIPVNKPYTVKWTPQTPGPVYIQLSYDDNVEATNITASTGNTGSFSWTPVDVFAGRNNYFLVLCDLKLSQDSCSYTSNGRFAIASSSSSSSSTSTTSTFSTRAPSPTPTSIPTTTSILIQTLTVTPISTATPAPDQPSGLPEAGKIAIGVVVPVFTILTAVLLFWLLWKRRKARQFGSANTNRAGLSRYEKAELPSEGGHGNGINSQGIRNIGARVELPTHEVSNIHELGIENNH